MTHDPFSRFAIIPINPGPAPDDAIVVGPYSEVMQYIPQSVARADALAELEQARFTAEETASMQEKTRAVQATMFANSVEQLARRLDALEARRAEQARRDSEEAEHEEAERIQTELNSLPDPDDPNADEAEGHIPGGDLHDIPAKVEHEPDPDSPEADDIGGVPISYGTVPTSYVRGGPKDTDTAGDLPEELSDPPEPVPEPEGTVFPQPTAIQANEE